jgi:hypothetical protein
MPVPFPQLVDKYIDDHQLYHFEGERGVDNFEKLVKQLGYQSVFGHGPIESFLADNPGAIEAMIEWIKTRPSPEWKQALEQS